MLHITIAATHPYTAPIEFGLVREAPELEPLLNEAPRGVIAKALLPRPRPNGDESTIAVVAKRAALQLKNVQSSLQLHAGVKFEPPSSGPKELASARMCCTRSSHVGHNRAGVTVTMATHHFGYSYSL